MRAALLSLALLATPALAQTEDRDFLTAFLEDSLSDAGREVTVTGFSGALSSQATIQQLTIADADGVWLTLNGLSLDWSRSALLSGDLSVNMLSVDEILMARLPLPSANTLPAPEAAPFRLPDLPVSIAIDRIAASRIVLGPEVLGQPVEGQLEASATLAGGTADVRLDLQRIGKGPGGRIALQAGFSNETERLEINLDATEDAGGIVVSLLGVPGTPAATVEILGEGPLNNHVARLRLATGGQDRLVGTVTLSQDATGQPRILADVAGNLAPLFLPDYAAFFGDSVALTVEARQTASGGLALDRLSLTAAALRLEGSAGIAPDGLPERVDLRGTLAAADARPVLLPLPGAPTRVGRVDFALTAQQGGQEGWSASIRIRDLLRDDLTADELVLDGSGRIGRTPAGTSFGGTLALAAEGLAPADPALATALGPSLTGRLRFFGQEGGGTLTLSDMSLGGSGYGLTGSLRIEGLAEALQTTGSITLSATDLARVSALVGRPLGGNGRLRIEGAASPLTGAFDLEIEGAVTDLRLGIAQADRLLAGASTLRLSVLRDETGTRLRDLKVAAGALQADGSGKLASAGSTLTGRVKLADLAALDPRYSGSLALDLAYSGSADAGRLTVSGLGQEIRLGQPQADRLLQGDTRLTAEIVLTEGAAKITTVEVTNTQLRLALAATATGLALDARLANLALLLPDLPGAVTLTGTADPTEGGYALALSGRGPGGLDARLAGTIAEDGTRADLRLAGSGQAVLANLWLAPRAVDGAVGFDLQLTGALALPSLSGRVTLSDGRVSDPDLGLSLENVEALAQLGGGQARLSATSRLAGGGVIRVDGPVALQAPYTADFAIALDRLRLSDPELYATTLTGGLALKGPLTGGAALVGALTLGETDLRVAASGFTGAGALLQLQHVNEPPAVHATRQRAGLLGVGAGTATSGPPIRVDLTINAPARIFVRGRGIDAELGGQIRLAGSSAALVPSGGFTLIRGRLDILGKRLVLSQADLRLEGSFVPMLDITAQTESDGITSTVRIEGPADDPEVAFTSSPERPQEEVLARLLFGRDLGQLSAFQAAQLANAVAVLAGRGGEGIVNRLRQGFGLDDLDLATSDDGSTALTAGKYLSENLYSEIEVEPGGTSRINLNLDLREGVTLRGAVSNDGNTGVGVFIERDY